MPLKGPERVEHHIRQTLVADGKISEAEFRRLQRIRAEGADVFDDLFARAFGGLHAANMWPRKTGYYRQAAGKIREKTPISRAGSAAGSPAARAEVTSG